MTTAVKIRFQGLSTDEKPMTEDETAVARRFGISTDAFATQRARNQRDNAVRELRVAAAAAGLVERKPIALLNRGRVAISFRGNAA